MSQPCFKRVSTMSQPCLNHGFCLLGKLLFSSDLLPRKRLELPRKAVTNFSKNLTKIKNSIFLT